jgi:hypothetical protein
LRYVRNQLGRGADPAEFIHPDASADGSDDGPVSWTWQPLPAPRLTALAPAARQWEMSRYRAYQGRLSGREIARTFSRCAEFLTQAASFVSASGAGPGDK